MDLEDGEGPTRASSNLRPIPFSIIRDYMAVSYALWVGVPPEVQALPREQSLFYDTA